MGPVHAEMEPKFEVGDDAVLPAPEGIEDVAIVEGPLLQDLEARYFDTATLALATEGLTLRRRTGGDDAGWHLKIPAAGGSRDEIRVPLGRAVKTVPKPLRAAVQLHARGHELVPIARIGTHRRVYRMCDSAHRVLLNVCDDWVTTHGVAQAATGLTTAWREWEVEVVDGNQRHFEAAVAVLEQAGANPAEARSKLARVLEDRLPRPTEVSQARPRRRSPAADVVRARLREQTVELKHQDPLVRHDVPGAVHQMRVALRRLRSALATFRPLLDPDRVEPLREELKWVAGVLGEARDAEVMQERLTALVAEQPAELVIGPIHQRIGDHLAAAYHAGHARAVEAMQSQRYYALVGLAGCADR